MLSCKGRGWGGVSGRVFGKIQGNTVVHVYPRRNDVRMARRSKMTCYRVRLIERVNILSPIIHVRVCLHP